MTSIITRSITKKKNENTQTHANATVDSLHHTALNQYIN